MPEYPQVFGRDGERAPEDPESEKERREAGEDEEGAGLRPESLSTEGPHLHLPSLSISDAGPKDLQTAL